MKTHARKSLKAKSRKTGAALSKKKSKVDLTFAQWDMVGQFNDYSYEYPKLNFDQVAKKVLGARPFPATPRGRKYRAECKEVFDREREPAR